MPCCPKTYIFDKDTLACVCPANAPYVKFDGSCVSCVAPARWNADTDSCDKCREGMSEDANGVCVCPK